MPNEKPKVSVIITTYKRPELLKRAVKSVVEQTMQDWELIIVDDCSPDHTGKLVEKLREKHKLGDKLVYHRLEKNHGDHSKPKNEGVRLAKADLIAYLDDDNEFLPSHLDTLVTEQELSGADVVYGDSQIIDEKNEEHRSLALDYDPQFLMRRSYIDTNQVLHTKQSIYQVGGWDETLKRFGDWNLFVRMTKAGLSFKHVPIVITRYHITKDNSANRFPAPAWQDPETGLTMFKPDFSPGGCPIYLPYLGYENKRETNPRVAIFTITYDRLDYTQRMWESMKEAAGYEFDWFVFDNGSQDGTPEWLEMMGKAGNIAWSDLSKENTGLTHASNACVDAIMEKGDYDIVIKVDNDCLFLTDGWLSKMVAMWQRNHKLYMGPYPEGLVDHPGGAPRVGHAKVGDTYVEIVQHLSGICAAVDASAYKRFRWKDKFMHGYQDAEATTAFRAMHFQPTIIPEIRIQHMDTTAGQKDKYPDYFERRKKEKATHYEPTNTNKD